MPNPRRKWKPTGPPPEVEKREHYLRLVGQGMDNSAACREVGINRRTGTRWRYGRTVTNPDGSTRTYPPITGGRALSPRFLSEDERVVIADRLVAGHSIRSIAAELGRSASTVSREIRRNRDPNTGDYQPFRAQVRAAARRARPKTGKLAANAELRSFVQEQLDRRWSPEQIATMLPVVFPDRPDMRVAHETIYQALYISGRGLLHRNPARVLRTGRTRRRRRRRPIRTTRFAYPMTMIHDRPLEAVDRLVAGHWEGDLIMGAGNRSAVGTVVERTTRYTLLLHLPQGHAAEHVSNALARALGDLPPLLVRSLTWDQGIELARHNEFTAATNIPVFFCDPASPWQRGSNENTNGLLRQYFPKGSDLRVHDAACLAAVADELNQRPRKTLGWQTPHQRLAALLTTST